MANTEISYDSCKWDFVQKSFWLKYKKWNVLHERMYTNDCFWFVHIDHICHVPWKERRREAKMNRSNEKTISGVKGRGNVKNWIKYPLKKQITMQVSKSQQFLLSNKGSSCGQVRLMDKLRPVKMEHCFPKKFMLNKEVVASNNLVKRPGKVIFPKIC